MRFATGPGLDVCFIASGNEAACERLLLQARWPQGFVCPRCQGQAHSTFMRGGRLFWQCRICRSQTSLRAGTVFDHSRLPLTTWFLALYLLTQSKNNVAAPSTSSGQGWS